MDGGRSSSRSPQPWSPRSANPAFVRSGDLVTRHRCHTVVCGLFAAVLVASLSADAHAKEWFVASGGAGNGTAKSPFGTIQAALRVAQSGDTVVIRGGTYQEAIRTFRDGSAAAPITVRGDTSGMPAVITIQGRVLQVDHSFITVEHVVVDAAYGARTAVKVSAGTRSVVLRDVEVRRSGRDCIDIGAASDVLIEDSL